MSVHLNILCLVRINLYYTLNNAEFDKMHGVYPIFNSNVGYSESDSNDCLQLQRISPDEIFNIGTLYLDNRHQTFWPLIDRCVQHVRLI